MNKPTEQMREEFKKWLINYPKVKSLMTIDEVSKVSFDAYKAAHARLMPLLVEARDLIDEYSEEYGHECFIPVLAKLNAAIGGK